MTTIEREIEQARRDWELEQYSTPELVRELLRRNTILDTLSSGSIVASIQTASAELEVSMKHYGHTVDVTDYPFFCSDCELEIRGAL
jgi:hypothetical protein